VETFARPYSVGALSLAELGGPNVFCYSVLNPEFNRRVQDFLLSWFCCTTLSLPICDIVDTNTMASSKFRHFPTTHNQRKCVPAMSGTGVLTLYLLQEHEKESMSYSIHPRYENTRNTATQVKLQNF
jgi:hypothetical protein